MNLPYNNKENLIAKWLLFTGFMVIIMVLVGGLTRLTDSGLSIVEWRPVTGIIPPISYQDWLDEFTKYQQSPEFKLINSAMTLQEFKFIFFLEYFHRLLGRLVGFVFLIPFLYFLAKGYLNKKQIIKYSAVFALGGLQGIIGWYMVKSGLAKDPHVSHFRLAMHLGMAAILVHFIFWLALNLIHKTKIPSFSQTSQNSILKHAKFVIANIYIQIISGALVAGLDAGLIYNTFPLMNGNFFPDEIYQLQNISALFTQPGNVQFSHRVIAYILVINILALCLRITLIKHNNKELKLATIILSAMTLLQLSLGIAAILYIVPINIAILHQLGAIFLLCISVYVYHNIMHKRTSQKEVYD